jgi:hypothetical protein
VGAAAERPRNAAPITATFRERETTATPPFDMTIDDNKVILRTIGAVVNALTTRCKGDCRSVKQRDTVFSEGIKPL